MNQTATCTEECLLRLYVTLISFCLVAVFVNLYILISTAWLRQHRSTNIKLCISLCAADTFAAIDHITMVILLITAARHLHRCVILTLLVFTWASTANCILHVVAIACTQLVGVWFPIQSRYWLSGRFTRILIACMWAVPICGYVSGIYLTQAAREEPICDFSDFVKVQFRTLQTCIVVPAFVATLLSYCYMLFLMNNRNNDTLTEGGTTKAHWAHRRQAVITAVLIAASLGVGYLPITIVNQIICPDGCPVDPSLNQEITIAVTSSTYILTMIKLSANAFIYVSRIPAIRDSIKRMNATIMRKHYVGVPFSSSFRTSVRSPSWKRRSSYGRSESIYKSSGTERTKLQIVTKLEPMCFENDRNCCNNDTIRTERTDCKMSVRVTDL